MPEISLNHEQRLYVIAFDGGVSCFGFDNARYHTQQIAELLQRSDLAFRPEDLGALSGYDRYLRAIDAWRCSPRSEKTYFDPGTEPKAKQVLERCRRQGPTVRIILGDPASGECWLEESDVVGRIRRSTGPLKVPLLVGAGESGGPAILTAYILAIADWQSGRFLYRHPAFHAPALSIVPSTVAGYAWEVLRDGSTLVARFRDMGVAGGYVAFMRGATVEPRVFL